MSQKAAAAAKMCKSPKNNNNNHNHHASHHAQHLLLTAVAAAANHTATTTVSSGAPPATSTSATIAEKAIEYERLSTNCTIVGSNNLHLVKKPMVVATSSVSPVYANSTPSPGPYGSPAATIKSPSTPQPTFPLMQIINPVMATTRPMQQNPVIKLKPPLNILPKPAGVANAHHHHHHHHPTKTPTAVTPPQQIQVQPQQATIMPQPQLLLNQMPMLAAAPGVRFILQPQTAKISPQVQQTPQGLILQQASGQQLLQLQQPRSQPMVRVLTNGVLPTAGTTFVAQVTPQTTVASAVQQQHLQQQQHQVQPVVVPKKKPPKKKKQKLDLANIMKLSGIGDDDDVMFESDTSTNENDGHNGVEAVKLQQPPPQQQQQQQPSIIQQIHQHQQQQQTASATPIVQVLNQTFQQGGAQTNHHHHHQQHHHHQSIPSFGSFSLAPNFTIGTNGGLMVQRSGGFKLALGEDGRLVLQHDPTLNQDLQSQLLLQSIFGLNGGLVLQPSIDQQIHSQTVQTIQQQSVQTIQQQTVQSQTIQTVQHQIVQPQALQSIQSQIQGQIQSLLQQQNISLQPHNITLQGLTLPAQAQPQLIQKMAPPPQPQVRPPTPSPSPIPPNPPQTSVASPFVSQHISNHSTTTSTSGTHLFNTLPSMTTTTTTAQHGQQPVQKVQPFQKSQPPVQTVHPIHHHQGSQNSGGPVQQPQQQPTSYVVNLTPEQLEQLKRNGQLTVNGQTIFMQRPPNKNEQVITEKKTSTSPKIKPIKKPPPMPAPGKLPPPVVKDPVPVTPPPQPQVVLPPPPAPKSNNLDKIINSVAGGKPQPQPSVVVPPTPKVVVAPAKVMISPTRGTAPKPTMIVPAPNVTITKSHLDGAGGGPEAPGTHHHAEVERFLGQLIEETQAAAKGGAKPQQVQIQQMQVKPQQIIIAQHFPATTATVTQPTNKQQQQHVTFTSQAPIGQILHAAPQILTSQAPPQQQQQQQQILTTSQPAPILTCPTRPTVTQQHLPTQQQVSAGTPPANMSPRPPTPQAQQPPPTPPQIIVTSSPLVLPSLPANGSQRVHTIQLTPQKQQHLKSIQLQIQTLSARMQPGNVEMQNALKVLFQEQQKILASGKLLPPDKVFYHGNQLIVSNAGMVKNELLHSNAKGGAVLVPPSPSPSPTTTTPEAVVKPVLAVLQPKQEPPESPPIMAAAASGSSTPPAAPSTSANRVPLYMRAQLIEQQMHTDQNGAIKPDIHTPFRDKADACKRLLRYHCFEQPVLSEKDLDKADEIFELTARHFIGKFGRMVDKYRFLLHKESQRHVQTSELMMLDRMFLSEEQQSILKLRQEIEECNMEMQFQEQMAQQQQQQPSTGNGGGGSSGAEGAANALNSEDYDEWACIQRELGCLPLDSSGGETPSTSSANIATPTNMAGQKRPLASSAVGIAGDTKKSRAIPTTKNSSGGFVLKQSTLNGAGGGGNMAMPPSSTSTSSCSYAQRLNMQQYAATTHITHTTVQHHHHHHHHHNSGGSTSGVASTTFHHHHQQAQQQQHNVNVNVNSYNCSMTSSTMSSSGSSSSTSTRSNNEEVDSIDEQVQSAIDSILNLQQNNMDLDETMQNMLS